MIKKIHFLLLNILILSNQSTFSQNNLSKKEIFDSVILVLSNSVRWYSDDPSGCNPYEIPTHESNVAIEDLNPNYDNFRWWHVVDNGSKSYGCRENPKNIYTSGGIHVDTCRHIIFFSSETCMGPGKFPVDSERINLILKNIKELNFNIEKNSVSFYNKYDYSYPNTLEYFYDIMSANNELVFKYGKIQIFFNNEISAIKFYKLVKQL